MANSGIHNSSTALHGAINGRFFLPVDSDGGVALQEMKPGVILEVATQNSVYTVIPQGAGEAVIWGHPEYCPEPLVVAGIGAIYMTGIYREGYLAPGMRLSFPKDGRRVNTSRIVSIQAKLQN